MKSKLFVIAGASVLVAASVLAATSVEAAPPAAPSRSQGAIESVQYYYRDHPRSPQYWQRGGYDPWVWRHQRHFLSRQRDFYGSLSFHGS